ncbi:MAG TPA: nitrite/sulfite reductase [Thermoanaerobaculia bacterium]|jgi:ferredoxin-nitrite reductase|nr:nitrite/sulfite reductase [Thermoanaerobaculia bacterium]
MPERSPEAAEITWDLVRKRNFVERLKHEKGGLDVIRDLPAMIAAGYEAVPEEDFVRMQWYGLYHDKPKVGHFMLRVKTPGGVLTAPRLRTIGEISQRFGRGHGEITTRQNFQLHWIELARLPEVLGLLESAGLTTTGACGDNVRTITGCPVSGLAAGELFEVQPLIEEATDFFIRNREYSDLPRKHKITISACPHQCNAPEIHCIALIGALRDTEPGFGVRVGGGLSTWPRLADDLGVWVPAGEALEVLRAIVDVWRLDLKYRMSRAKARLKFMVHDLGPEAFRTRVEEKLGRRLEDGAAPLAPAVEHDHTGVHPEKADGLFYAGFPVHLGLMDGATMLKIADLAESWGGEIRLTRRQNFILSHIPEARVDEVVREVASLGFPLAGTGLRGASIACTGDPFCNYTVAETKGKLQEIVEHLERELGGAAAGLRLNLDGCPHACAHHWIGDIGIQGTTLRERGPHGERLDGYDLFLRGGLGRNAAIGRPVLKRVPGDEVHLVIERLLRAWLDGRGEGEPIQQFFTRHTDEDLVALGLGAAVTLEV